MNRTFKHFFALLFLFQSCFIGLLNAQQVWPGDVTNNGIVNHVDFLFLGDAFFEAGSPRESSEMGIDWSAKELINPWGMTFPGTAIDYAYADCNGDGLVLPDDIAAIETNYGLTHGVVVPDLFPPGIQGVDPEIFFDESNLIQPVVEGSLVLLPIHLGSEDAMVNDFMGIGMTIKYDPEIIQAQDIQLFFSDSWINPSGNDLIDFIRNDEVDGELTVAATRAFSNLPVTGAGPIGALFIIIEDDVVGLSDPSIESIIEIEDVLLMSPELTTQPVVTTDFSLTIFPDAITLNEETPFLEEQIKVFPNPVQDELHIVLENTEDLQGIEVLNALGQRVMWHSFSNRLRYDVNTQTLADGIYYIQLHLESQVVNKKIIISRE